MNYATAFFLGVMVGIGSLTLWLTYITARYAPATLVAMVVALIERYGRPQPESGSTPDVESPRHEGGVS